MALNKFGNFAALSLALIFAACGGDSGSNGKTDTDVSVQAETFDDLPNCSKNREGEIYEVIDNRKTYQCVDGRWEEYVSVPDSVKTEDDLPACHEKLEGRIAIVSKDTTAWGCFDSRWEKIGKAYESVDDLPNCSEKRDGSVAHIMEDVKTLVCSDGKWATEKNDSSDQGGESKSEVKSSSSNKTSSSSVTEKETAKSSSSVEKIPDSSAEHSSSSIEEIIPDMKLPVYSSMEEFPKCVFEDLGTIVVNLSDTSYFICQKEGLNSMSDFTMDYIKIKKGEMKLVFDAAFGECSEKLKNQKFDLFGKKIVCEENSEFHYYSYHYYNEFDSVTDNRDGQEYKTIKIGRQTWMAENLNYDYKIDGIEFGYCYGNKSDNCKKYGRLYTWAAAMDSAAVFSEDGKGCGAGPKNKINSVVQEGKILNDTIWYCKPRNVVRGICPQNWHLPSVEEYRQLVEYVSGESCIWYNSNSGSNSSTHACAGGVELKSSSGWSHGGNGSDEFGFSALPAGFSYSLLDSTAAFWVSGFELNAYVDNVNAKAITMDYSHGNVNFNDIIPAREILSIRCIKDE